MKMTLAGVISYPIPEYSNVPIHSEYYQPSVFVISSITIGATTLVTTVLDHNYVVGQQIRLLIPATFGCIQLNNVTGFVISIPSSTQVETDIYSLNGNPYIASSSFSKSQILAIGDLNTGDTNTNGRTNNITFVPGSFINISPL